MNSIFNLFKKNALSIICLMSFSYQTVAGEAENEWPRKIESDKGTVTIYQPQIESLTNDKLEARAAVSVNTPEMKSPKFGAMWFSCRISTDKNNRTVTLIDLKVTASKFPDIEESKVTQLNQFVEDELPKWELVMSLDRLLAGLEMTEESLKQAEEFHNDPPEIIYTTTPCVLIYIDGEPVMKDTDQQGFKYVVNTPFFIVQDVQKKKYYIKGGDFWYSSEEIMKGWKNIKEPPKPVEKLAEQAIKKENDKSEEKTADKGNEEEEPVVPELIVRTKPAELLLVDGEPQYAPIEGTSLLYMTNTDSDVIMDINSQLYYLLISGRWYQSSSLTGNNWKFIKPTEVPEDFARIPSDSEMANVKASVAGTQEAKDAVLENQIPQTAEVSRKEATLSVKYDGNPKFESIEGTEMRYAVNTDKSVIQIGKKYYCCDNAIWFEADKPEGPWTVSVAVPNDVQKIPPESPVYNVKYVYIYDYTPEVVYVGYTPGYVYSYVYMGCVYYGTGFYYAPWYGAYYYPRPVTYGFGVHYNPWTGWSFSISVSYGWMSVGWHSYPHGYWGPAGYHAGYRHGYYHGYNRGFYQGARAGYRAGYNAANRNDNVYRNRDGVVNTGGGRSNTSVSTLENTGRTSGAASGKVPAQAKGKNNIYADRDGNVYKQDKSGWKQQQNGKWNEISDNTTQNKDMNRGGQTRPSTETGSRPSQQPSNKYSGSQPKNMDNLNRDANARNYGNQRSQSYNQSRSGSYSGSRSGGGYRSGGRR